MSDEVLTPISQAMKEGVLTRSELRELMQRNNTDGLVHLFFFLLALGVSGVLVWLAMGTWWVVPAMFLHGFLVVHHFSLQHECCHYTPFRTRWINEVVGHYCGFVLIIPNKFFRYEHCNHHTYTQQLGRDPELIELPISLGQYLRYVSSYPYWKAKFTELFNHSLGRITETEKEFVPPEEQTAIIREARIYLLGYTLIMLASAIFNWWGVLWLWWLPMFMGEPFMRMIRMAEHVGRPNVSDMRQNTRSSLISKPLRLLCWNMNYHAEHHYASSVPFHALPQLHKKLKGYVYIEERGYWGAHLDILRQMFAFRPSVGKNSVP